MSKPKYILLVGDGMGDVPIEALGGMTPLEAAKTPAMDFISQHGIVGQVQTVPTGFPPGSDVANLSLLGYNPQEVYTGRSPLEAASLGVELADDEIAFRCNLVNIKHDDSDRVTMVDYSGGHIETPEARQLIASINKHFSHDKITLYPGVSYRHLLVYKGDTSGLSTVPPHDFTGQDVTSYWLAYKNNADLLYFIEKASDVLATHPLNTKRLQQGKLPANSVWLWGEGRAPTMPKLQDRFGISGSLISAVDLLKGIGIYAGMEIVEVPGATGYLDTNYQGKVDAAINALQHKDLVLVHVEAPDETGHQGLLDKKITAIEDFDQKIIQPILDKMLKKEDFRLVICMDHFTPIHLRTHTADPVPFALYDSRRPEFKKENTYSEENGRKSLLKIDNGEDFMRFVLEI